jgi:hypothetical protein
VYEYLHFFKTFLLAIFDRAVLPLDGKNTTVFTGKMCSKFPPIGIFLTAIIMGGGGVNHFGSMRYTTVYTDVLKIAAMEIGEFHCINRCLKFSGSGLFQFNIEIFLK